MTPSSRGWRSRHLRLSSSPARLPRWPLDDSTGCRCWRVSPRPVAGHARDMDRVRVANVHWPGCGRGASVAAIVGEATWTAVLCLEAVSGRSVVMATVARAKVARLAATSAAMGPAAAVPAARRLSRARAVEVATCRLGRRSRPLLDGKPRRSHGLGCRLRRHRRRTC